MPGAHARCARSTRLDVARRGDYVVFDVCANAFLHHMVRNIVGSLVYVGKGKHPPEWVGEVLASRDRAQRRADVRGGRAVSRRV